MMASPLVMATAAACCAMEFALLVLWLWKLDMALAIFAGAAA